MPVGIKKRQFTDSKAEQMRDTRKTRFREIRTTTLLTVGNLHLNIRS